MYVRRRALTINFSHHYEKTCSERWLPILTGLRQVSKLHLFVAYLGRVELTNLARAKALFEQLGSATTFRNTLTQLLSLLNGIRQFQKLEIHVCAGCERGRCEFCARAVALLWQLISTN